MPVLVEYYPHSDESNNDEKLERKIINVDNEGRPHNINDLPAYTKYDKFGNLVTVKWYKHGVLCRDNDKPAKLKYFEENKKNESVVCLRIWYEDNKIHRDNGPAFIAYDYQGNVIEEWWYKYGLIHRDNDEPAFIEYQNNTVASKHWYINGITYRENDKPSCISYFTENNLTENNVSSDYVSSESWTNKEGKSYRDNEPSYIIYNRNGTVIMKEWRNENYCRVICYHDNGRFKKEKWFLPDYIYQFHRADGPAYIKYGQNYKEIWYFNNKKHRDNGPAVTKNSDTFTTLKWYTHGILTRVEYTNNIEYDIL